MLEAFKKYKNAICAVASLFVLSGCALDVGEAERVGVVAKIGKVGMIWTTMEGEMALANIRAAGSTGTGSTFGFNVQDPNLYKILHKAMDDQTPIKAYYKIIKAPWPWAQENDAVITRVDVLAAPISSPLGLGGREPSKAAGAPSGTQARNGVLMRCYEVREGASPVNE